jgi:choline dehydrogenase-like flavoprotein
MSFASVWEKGLDDVFIAAEELGLGVNPDITSGNPLGMGLGPSTLRFGDRSTASQYLDDSPSNLTVVTNAPAAKILFDGNTATGVKTIDGREFLASKDVIISAGSVNSPHLLLLSGIGPAAELEKHNIPLLKDLPQVGKNLTDHAMFTATLLQKPGTSDRAALVAEAETEAAKEQYEKYKTGPLTTVYGSIPMGWFKSDAIYASEEFAALPQHTQEHLKKATMPLFELATVSHLL